MPQVPSDDLITTFVEGLVTETSKLNSKKNAASDLQNVVLRRDGSVKRRKAIDEEANGVGRNAYTTDETSAFSSVDWRSAGGDPSNNIVVTQVGSKLYFFKDNVELSANEVGNVIELFLYAVPLATESQVRSSQVSMSSGRGELYVTGRYIEALQIKYEVYDTWAAATAYALGAKLKVETAAGDFYVATCTTAGTSAPVTEPTWALGDNADNTVVWRILESDTVGTYDINAYPIEVLERDFWGVDDGILPETKPEDATIPDSHGYNLRNQGWSQLAIDTFFSDVSSAYWPAKNMHWYEGYSRALPASGDAYNLDAVKSWDTAKIDAEVYGGSQAPMGKFFRNMFDTTVTYGGYPDRTTGVAAIGMELVGTNFENLELEFAAPYSWTVLGEPELWLEDFVLDTINISDEGLTVGHYNINSQAYTWSVVSTTKLIINLNLPGTGITRSIWSTSKLGTVYTYDADSGISDPNGYIAETRFEACAWFAGRLWFSGHTHPNLLGRVFFSQIAVKDDQLGKCYQKNDPTGRLLTALEDDDGGYINLPEVGAILAMHQVGGELFIFAEQGVWAIGGGQRGYFTAGGFSVRQVTAKECISKSVVNTGSELIYFGPTGVHLLGSQYVGLTDNIQTFWDAIPYVSKQNIQACFDENRGLLYVAYSNDGVEPKKLDRILIFDMVLKAWYKYTLTNATEKWLMGLLAIDSADDQTVDNKIKYFCIYDLDYKSLGVAAFIVCDSNQTGYTDWTGTEEEAYIETGYNLGVDASRRFQAPIIHVHMEKTETGFTDPGTGILTPVNPSSVLMTTKWDFTDSATPSKWTEDTEVYRHTRAYTPVDINDTFADGYPVVITRNKVRGRGRALQIKFAAGTAKDAHILGWNTHLKVSGRL